MKLNLLMWMALSLVCFSIFNAYRYIEDKEMNTILLVGLYLFIGLYAFLQMTTSLCETKLFRDKILHYFWIVNGMAIPMSIFLMMNHSKLVMYLTYQFVILTIVGITYNGIKELKKKRKIK